METIFIHITSLSGTTGHSQLCFVKMFASITRKTADKPRLLIMLIVMVKSPRAGVNSAGWYLMSVSCPCACVGKPVKLPVPGW